MADRSKIARNFNLMPEDARIRYVTSSLSSALSSPNHCLKPFPVGPSLSYREHHTINRLRCGRVRLIDLNPVLSAYGPQLLRVRIAFAGNANKFVFGAAALPPILSPPPLCTVFCAVLAGDRRIRRPNVMTDLWLNPASCKSAAGCRVTVRWCTASEGRNADGSWMSLSIAKLKSVVRLRIRQTAHWTHAARRDGNWDIG